MTTISAMQQTDDALAVAVKFEDLYWLEHDPDCECPPENPIAIHRKKCKIVKRGRCTCKPVLVHAAVIE